MAGSGPAPAEQKRRRNKPEQFEELPAEGYQGDYPELPEGYEVALDDKPDVEGDDLTVLVPYRAETREWYEDWARSPMATKFAKTDWNRLRYVIAPLFDAAIRRPGDTKLAAELRLQETLLGGTALDRLRLRQRIAERPESAAPQRRASRGGTDRRARLSVVQ